MASLVPQKQTKKKPSLVLAIGIGKGREVPPPPGSKSPTSPMNEPSMGEPDADEQGGPPDMDMDDPMIGTSPSHPMDQASSMGGNSPMEAGEHDAKLPQWLQYHSGQEVCSTCEYMQPDGSCSVLHMPVEHNAHCMAWEPKGADSDLGLNPNPMGQDHPMDQGGMGQQTA